jgi:hypothetical protein
MELAKIWRYRMQALGSGKEAPRMVKGRCFLLSVPWPFIIAQEGGFLLSKPPVDKKADSMSFCRKPGRLETMMNM